MDYVIAIDAAIFDDKTCHMSGRLINLETGEVIKTANQQRRFEGTTTITAMANNIAYRLLVNKLYKCPFMRFLNLFVVSILMFGLQTSAQQKVAIYLNLNRYSDYKANELKSLLIIVSPRNTRRKRQALYEKSGTYRRYSKSVRVLHSILKGAL